MRVRIFSLTRWHSCLSPCRSSAGRAAHPPLRDRPQQRRRKAPSAVSRISLSKFCRVAAEQELHPCNGAPPTGGVAASRAMTRLSRQRRCAASRSECASVARPARREARVPAGQPKDSAPSRSEAGKSAALNNPAHFPTLPIVTRRAKTTGLVRVANRAGCLQTAPNALI